MHPNIKSLFPSYVYVEGKIDNFDDIQQEMRGVVDSIKFNLHSDWKDCCLSNTDFNDNLLDKMPLFRKELCKHVENYCEEMRFYDDCSVDITSSWFVKIYQHNYAHIHTHKDADITGVYYLKTNGDDGSLFFLTPNPGQECSRSWADHRIYEAPENGKLLLFPGWLKHGVTRNLTEKSRISFSFNINVYPKGFINN